MKKLSGRSRLYLEACPDWSADWEIVQRMGDNPPMQAQHARPHLGTLIMRGLVEWHRGNNTYRITDAGRTALRTHKGTDHG